MTSILFITHYSGLYGANKSLLTLLEGVANSELKSLVIIPYKGEIEIELKKRNICYKTIKIPLWSVEKKTFKNYLRLLINTIRAIFHLIPITKKHKIDVIYTNSSITPIGIILSTFFGLPHIWHLREFGLVDYGLQYLLPNYLVTKIILKSSAIVCVSEAVKNYYFPFNDNKIHVVYNGISENDKLQENFRNYSSQKFPDFFIFAIIGFISHKKGQFIAIKAIHELLKKGLSAKLFIIGNGDEDELVFCKNYIRNNNLSNNIYFFGYVENPMKFITFDCLLMCSENEAMGRVTAEAFSSGIPVIGKNSGGTPELIKNNFNGFLYNSFLDLINIMEYLVKNPNETIRLGINGLSTAKDLFTVEKYSNSIKKIIVSILK